MLTCNVCGSEARRKCGGCHALHIQPVRYCGPECQHRDWPTHKKLHKDHGLVKLIMSGSDAEADAAIQSINVERAQTLMMDILAYATSKRDLYTIMSGRIGAGRFYRSIYTPDQMVNAPRTSQHFQAEVVVSELVRFDCPQVDISLVGVFGSEHGRFLGFMMGIGNPTVSRENDWTLFHFETNVYFGVTIPRGIKYVAIASDGRGVKLETWVGNSPAFACEVRFRLGSFPY